LGRVLASQEHLGADLDRGVHPQGQLLFHELDLVPALAAQRRKDHETARRIVRLPAGKRLQHPLARGHLWFHRTTLLSLPEVAGCGFTASSIQAAKVCPGSRMPKWA